MEAFEGLWEGILLCPWSLCTFQQHTQPFCSLLDSHLIGSLQLEVVVGE